MLLEQSVVDFKSAGTDHQGEKVKERNLGEMFIQGVHLKFPGPQSW